MASHSSFAILLLIAGLALLATETHGGAVHQIPVRHQSFPDEFIANEHPLATRSLTVKTPKKLDIKKHPSVVAKPSLAHSLQELKVALSYLIGDVSFGSPDQHFTGAFIPFSAETYFIGANVSTHKPKHEYNYRASSTFKKEDRTFTAEFEQVTGHIASDFIDVDGVRARVNVGVAESVSRLAIIDYIPVDAAVGLLPRSLSGKPSNISLLPQLLSALEQPLISFYVNRSDPVEANWRGSLTLGALDNDHCDPKAYSFTPELNLYLDVAVSSLKIGSGRYPLNGTVVLTDFEWPLFVSENAFDALVNVSGAKNYWDTGYYKVDCKTVNSLADVTLNLGADGKAPVTLHPRDYVKVSDHLFGFIEFCYLNVEPLYSDDTDSEFLWVVLGRQFLNNHCIAYNFDDDTLGFAATRRAGQPPAPPQPNSTPRPPPRTTPRPPPTTPRPPPRTTPKRGGGGSGGHNH
jgi:hypothetical protein